jgi:hypothetical protein
MHPDSKRSPITGTERHFLNEPQHRHFAVFLSMLEDALSEINQLAGSRAGAEENLTLYDADLPDAFANSAEPSFRSIRREIAALARVLEIKPQHRSQRRTIRALLTAELVRLDDSYAHKLRGYGAVDPRARNALDPTLDRIRSELTALLDLLGSEQTGSSGRGKRPHE